MKKSLFAIFSLVFTLAVGFTGLGLNMKPKIIDAHDKDIVTEAATTTAENRTIQTKLKRWGYYKGSIDGIYGSQTRAAVRYFQQKNGLAVDGIVGPNTAAALGMTLSSSTSSQSSSDLYLLAKCVYAEARGEPYTGQVAVAAVILNRVENSAFPNTISGVIYQKGAFTAVTDGQINLTPNSTAYKAAQDALNGWDPTYGCIYYYNPATATSSWIWSRQVVVTIGNHVFCL